jgi:hypothetical protein
MENLRSEIENVMFAAGCDMVGVANVKRSQEPQDSSQWVSKNPNFPENLF